MKEKQIKKITRLHAFMNTFRKIKMMLKYFILWLYSVLKKSLSLNRLEGQLSTTFHNYECSIKLLRTLEVSITTRDRSSDHIVKFAAYVNLRDLAPKPLAHNTTYDDLVVDSCHAYLKKYTIDNCLLSTIKVVFLLKEKETLLVFTNLSFTVCYQ